MIVFNGMGAAADRNPMRVNNPHYSVEQQLCLFIINYQQQNMTSRNLLSSQSLGIFQWRQEEHGSVFPVSAGSVSESGVNSNCVQEITKSTETPGSHVMSQWCHTGFLPGVLSLIRRQMNLVRTVITGGTDSSKQLVMYIYSHSAAVI